MTSSTVRALGNKSYTWGGGYWPGEQGLYLERGLNNTGPGNKVKKVQVWGTRVIPVEGVKYHWSGGRGLNNEISTALHAIKEQWISSFS